MKNNSIFRIAMILFCAGFLLTGTVTNGTESLPNLEERQSEIEREKEEIKKELEAQKSTLEKNQGELAVIIKEKADAMSEKDDLKLQLDTIFASLQQLEASIADAENEYNSKSALLKKRIRTMYQMGDYTILQMLIESDDLLDFLNRKSCYHVIIEKDQALIEEVQNLKTDLEIKKKTQVENQTSYEQLLAEQEALITKLQNNEDYLSSLSDTTRAMIDKLEAREDEMDKESEKLESKVRELQAQEEAKKQAASSSDGSSSNQEASYEGGRMLWPSAASTYISSYFGMRMHPIYHYMRMHNGIDIAAESGTNILAAESGTVIEATYNSGYGNYIVIYHGNGISTLYAHSSGLIASVGDRVTRGEVIALIGDTGNAKGYHLHFEVRKNGSPVNPLGYL